MRLRWTAIAASDLEDIQDYLSRKHPSFAKPTTRAIFDAIRSLREIPLRGRVGVVSGTRELFMTPLPYVVVYRVTGQIVEVLRVWHTSQDRPFRN